MDLCEPARTAAALSVALLLAVHSAGATADATSLIASAQPAGCHGSGPQVPLAPLEAEVLDAARAHFAGPPLHAPELSLAARDVAARLAAGERDVLGRRALRLSLARACAADPAVSVLAVSAARGQLVAALARELRPGDFTHLGVGVAVHGRFAHAVVIGTRRMAMLDPFPRELASGSSAQLRGRLLLGLDEPWVAITGPDGLARKIPTEGGAASFLASVTFETAGRYLVEVGGAGKRGPEVAALLVVAVGGASLDDSSRPLAQPDPVDAAEAESRVAAAVNALRRLHRLAPLEMSEPVRALARQYSAEMLRQRLVAHVLPGGGAVGDRLRSAGIQHQRIRENLAVGESAMAAHESLEESPAHLANLLDPELSQLGVGIARGTSPAGEPAVYLTEILLTPDDPEVEPPEQHPATPEAQILEALRVERKRLGRLPLREDKRLDELAAEAARDMLRANKLKRIDLAGIDLRPPGDVQFPFWRPIGRSRLAAADAFATSALRSAARSAVRSARVGDARFERVGIGVAESAARDAKARRFWIAVIYAD